MKNILLPKYITWKKIFCQRSFSTWVLNFNFFLYIILGIIVRRARHAGHCWRSKDELVSDVLLWTPTYGQAKAGRPARTYIQQLCEDTGCNPEDLPEAMNDKEKWREMVKDIRAGGTTWWWWWYIYIYIYICVCVYIYIYIYVCVCVCVCVCARLCVSKVAANRWLITDQNSNFE